MSQRQDIGLALSQLTYDTFAELLRTRLDDRGQEKTTKNGPMFSISHYTLFWNKHVVKEGEYFKIPGDSNERHDPILDVMQMHSAVVHMNSNCSGAYVSVIY